ncbi:MAG: class I tRNA ligase family protein, partial [Patescibacteria group bacterium]
KFTLDSDIVEQVQKTFVDLYNDGFIYRGERIVNWCRKHQTALADLETKHIEQTDPLYYFRYGPFVIATARPETKFGDKYVVMHPKDSRYKQYRDGQKIDVEWINGPITATIIKDEVIDMSFGTGVMTITPWHDPIDFELATRRELSKEQVIDRFGKLLPIAETFAGMRIDEARPLIVEHLKQKGLLVKIEENYIHKIAVCYKCETAIEPQILPQWFLKMAPLAKKAIEAVQKKKIIFVPARFKKVYLHWLTNIRDWNLSQQIMWGIRIPAWFCISCNAVRMKPKIIGNWYFVRHGETDWNVEKRLQGHSKTVLNENGRRQAREAAVKLKTQNIDLVVSSDLPRARETAQIIAQELHVEVMFDSALRERNYGIFEGKITTDISEDEWDSLRTSNYTPEKGESLDVLEDRVHQTLSRHKDEHRHKNVVVVSHGSALSHLISRLRNKGIEWRTQNRINNAQIIHFSRTTACDTCGSDFVEQDPDVLTTWFSSSQWSYLALGYPKNKDFKNFYPTDVMETGWDILFFWVARMVMLGLYRTRKVPFKTIYLHGLVRDKDRQ